MHICIHHTALQAGPQLQKAAFVSAGDDVHDDSWDSLGATAEPTRQPPVDVQLGSPTAPLGANRTSRFSAELWEWRRPTPGDLLYFRYELLGLLLVLLHLANRVRGSRENEEIALAWARQFVTKGCVLERNFALCGPGARPDEPWRVCCCA